MFRDLTRIFSHKTSDNGVKLKIIFDIFFETYLSFLVLEKSQVAHTQLPIGFFKGTFIYIKMSTLLYRCVYRISRSHRDRF